MVLRDDGGNEKQVGHYLETAADKS